MLAAKALACPAQDYLSGLPQTCGQYSLTESDRQLIESEGIKAYIYAKLTSKHFRKWKLADGTEERIRKAINLHIGQNTPIKLVFEFGGYKLWRLPSSPEPDWAEYFMLAHFAKYASAIAAGYKPGIRIVFASDDHVVERMNNIPKASTDAYCHRFLELINHFNNFMPDNLRFELVRLASLCESTQLLERELEDNFLKNIEKAKSWTPIKKDKMKRKAQLNFCSDSAFGVENLESISPDEYEARLLNGSIWHDAFEDVKARRAFVLGDDSILIFTTSIPQAIAIGSTKASVAKFWAGTGILEHTAEGFKTHILSPKQYEALPPQNIENIDVKMIAGKNFMTVPVSRTLINFSIVSK